MSRIGESVETESKLVVTQGWGRGSGGYGFLFEVMELSGNSTFSMMIAQHCEYTKDQ